MVTKVLSHLVAIVAGCALAWMLFHDRVSTPAGSSANSGILIEGATSETQSRLPESPIDNPIGNDPDSATIDDQDVVVAKINVDKATLLKVLDAPLYIENVLSETIVELLGLSEADVSYCNEVIEDSLKDYQALEAERKKRISGDNEDEWIEVPPLPEEGAKVKEELTAKLAERMSGDVSDVVVSLLGDTASFSKFGDHSNPRRFSIEEKEGGGVMRYFVTEEFYNSRGNRYKRKRYPFNRYSLDKLHRHYGHLFDIADSLR